VAVALAGITVAVACSKPPTSGGGGAVAADDLPDCPLDALEQADGPVEIALWYGGLAGVTQATMEGMAERFNAGQDEVVVTASNQGASYAEVYRKYESAASASTDQLPNVIYLEDTQLRAMVDGGRVLPAEACMRADEYDVDQMLPVVRSTYTVDDVLYPGYMNVSTPVLYYNQSHWIRAGLDPTDPPQTLDELRDVARTLKDAGVSARPFSFKLSRWFFETWLTGIGSTVVDEGNGRTGEPTAAELDSPEAVELLRFLQDMSDEGLMNPFAATEGSIDHYLALVNQQSSMLIETSAASTTIRDALAGTISADEAGAGVDASAIDTSQLVPAAAPLPGIEAPGRIHASGGAFFILNTSEPAQQAAAWRFLEFMLRPENAKEWFLSGAYLPIVEGVREEPEVQAFLQDDVAGKLLMSAEQQLADASPDAPGPLIGPYPDFNDDLERAMESAVLDGADPESALAGADDDITAALERYVGE
jgi:sn-glycerol 3-phosphate transport system substrate-binding protein